MRDYWDEGARKNAAWYVDTTVAYDEPDMDGFLEAGEQIVATLVDDAPLSPTGRGTALEIGSGLGRICRALSTRYEHVIGVDVSPEMVRQATELVTESNVTFRVGDGTGLSGIDDASVDLIVSFTVFQHIPKASIVHEYLAEAGRVLRPGGVFAFQWNNQTGPVRWAARRAALSALQKSRIRPEPYERNSPAFLGTCISSRSIERSLERSGLVLEATAGLGTLFAVAWARSPG
jgi:SAM-dependent methyltransferase